ncbi:RNA 2',3'-cyclic phosphodiesterase [Gilvimarinus sp. F26214L]|uniref:RNA 2',3'-cyclic phosphodiesterase n=1 Tax=Gilvimarinus sp. DZF01 TaxID=3461371 RepID=UPI00404564CD
MKRLFVAVPLAASLRHQLTPLLPRPTSHVRPVKPDQMHMTLHFIGDADLVPLAAALREINSPAFQINFEVVGTFGSPRRGGVFWVGSSGHPVLTALHGAMGRKLEALGLEVDERAYVPHITLARCRPRASHSVYEAFRAQILPDLAPLDVDRFVLYSSDQTPDGAVYTAEEVFWLDRPDDHGNGNWQV